MGEVVSGGLTGKFRNATPAQRKQMLLQRSTAHFKRSDLSDRKHEIGEAYKKEAISIAKGEI